MDEVIKEKLEFLKLEYQQLISEIEHLENVAWRIRQFSLSLWLVALGVGLGVITEGVKSDFNILIISAVIPIMFIYLDARTFTRWARRRARLDQIELFLSNREYILPSTGRRISFKQFCSDRKKAYEFPVLDFTGRRTFNSEKNYDIETGSALPEMLYPFRVIFYHFQLVASLVIIALQIHKLHNDAIVFSIIGISPLLHFSVLIFSKIREARIRRRAE